MSRLTKWEFLRTRVSWVLLGGLALSMVFFANWRVPSRGDRDTAGVIFGRKIPWETFEEQRGWVRRQWQHQMGDVPQALAPLLTQQVWDRLILLTEAMRSHVRVDDHELATFIQHMPDFQVNGAFSSEHYQQLLQANQMSPEVFEDQLRKQLMIAKLADRVKADVSVTDEEVKAAFIEAHERLRALLVIFDPSTYTAPARAAITEADVKAEYAAHPEHVRMPEQLVLDVAGASHEALAGRVQVKDEELKTYYADHQDEWLKDDQKTPKSFEEVRDEVRRQLTEPRVRKQLNALTLDLQDDVEAKRSFEEIVTARALMKQTIGPQAVDALLQSSAVDAAVIRAAEKLTPGQMSEVVETHQGVYLARLVQRIPSQLPSLDEVRQRLTDELVQTRAKTMAKDAALAWRTRMIEQHKTGLRFEEAFLLEAAVPMTQSATFTRSEPIDALGSAPAINAAAFETPLDQLTDVVEAGSRVVVVRPEARLPVDESTLAKEHDRLRQETLTKKQNARIEAWFEELRSRAALKNFVDTPKSPSSS